MTPTKEKQNKKNKKLLMTSAEQIMNGRNIKTQRRHEEKCQRGAETRWQGSEDNLSMQIHQF